MTRLVFALALACVGCGSLVIDPAKLVPPPPGAAEAIQAVADVYKMTSLPSVYWYGGAALDCADPAKPWCDGGHCWLSDNGSGCTAGESADGVALVSDWGGGMPISQMGTGSDVVLTHELAHLRWGDPNHTGHAFAVGGDSDRATAVLVEMGL